MSLDNNFLFISFCSGGRINSDTLEDFNGTILNKNENEGYITVAKLSVTTGQQIFYKRSGPDDSKSIRKVNCSIIPTVNGGCFVTYNTNYSLSVSFLPNTSTFIADFNQNKLTNPNNRLVVAKLDSQGNQLSFKMISNLSFNTTAIGDINNCNFYLSFSTDKNFTDFNGNLVTVQGADNTFIFKFDDSANQVSYIQTKNDIVNFTNSLLVDSETFELVLFPTFGRTPLDFDGNPFPVPGGLDQGAALIKTDLFRLQPRSAFGITLEKTDICNTLTVFNNSVVDGVELGLQPGLNYYWENNQIVTTPTNTYLGFTTVDNQFVIQIEKSKTDEFSFYVGSAANGNIGDFETIQEAIDEANTLFNGTVSIYCYSGTYAGFTVSDAENKSLIIKAVNKENVVINSAINIENISNIIIENITIDNSTFLDITGTTITREITIKNCNLEIVNNNNTPGASNSGQTNVSLIDCSLELNLIDFDNIQFSAENCSITNYMVEVNNTSSGQVIETNFKNCKFTTPITVTYQPATAISLLFTAENCLLQSSSSLFILTNNNSQSLYNLSNCVVEQQSFTTITNATSMNLQLYQVSTVNVNNGSITTYPNFSFADGLFEDITAIDVNYTNLVMNSDKRLKNTIVSNDNIDLSKLKQIKCVNYRLNRWKDDNTYNCGFIAQNILDLFPEVIPEARKLKITENRKEYVTSIPDEDIFLTIDNTAMQNLLMRICKKQQTIIEEQQGKITKLENDISFIKNKLNLA